jgi:hypothetical protein
MDNTPTPEDMARDLAEDLSEARARMIAHSLHACETPGQRPLWVDGWPAAIRRAMAAEALLRAAWEAWKKGAESAEMELAVYAIRDHVGG